jgi:hypothetical protein
LVNHPADSEQSPAKRLQLSLTQPLFCPARIAAEPNLPEVATMGAAILMTLEIDDFDISYSQGGRRGAVWIRRSGVDASAVDALN